MAKKKSKKNKIEVNVTFKIKAIIRDDINIVDLLKEETEFMAEPQSANGCVTEMKLTKIDL